VYGNLFEPSLDAAVVEGGLRNPRKRAAASGIVGLGAAAGLWRSNGEGPNCRAAIGARNNTDDVQSAR
jgi:hypothetical protein